VRFILLCSVFVIATCGLVYELISGTLASYLLGDSVTQFSTVIGVYLFAMGIGSFLSRYVRHNLTLMFIRVELLIGLVGGGSACLLFLAFEHVQHFRVLLYALITIIGTLVGLEIPLLMRILKNHFDFRDLVAQVFTFDYVGGLVASILFPLLLVPHLGLIRSSFFFGMLNVLVALWALYVFQDELPWVRVLRALAVLILLSLTFGFVYSDTLMSFAEAASFPDDVIYAKSSPYQRIVLTHSPHDLRLYLNGNLQFSSRDEYRYHEALIHPGLQAVPNPVDVLVLGGGDGLAVREILKYPSVRAVTLVDLDADMTRLFATHPALVALNGGALQSERVRVINTDAFVWLQNNHQQFDFVVLDFPDPSNYSLGKLYTTAMFRLLYRAVQPGGAVVVQSTSPWVARKSFWCVDATLRSVGFQTVPYHAYVPSFGEWGFILAAHHALALPSAYPEAERFVTTETMRTMLAFPPDMQRVDTEVNRLSNQVLVRYFEEEWAHD